MRDRRIDILLIQVLARCSDLDKHRLMQTAKSLPLYGAIYSSVSTGFEKEIDRLMEGKIPPNL